MKYSTNIKLGKASSTCSRKPLLIDVTIVHIPPFNESNCTGILMLQKRPMQQQYTFEQLTPTDLRPCLWWQPKKGGATKMTIPRFELCGAQLLSKLLRDVKNALNIDYSLSFAWTDRLCPTDWMGAPNVSKRLWATVSRQFLN